MECAIVPMLPCKISAIDSWWISTTLRVNEESCVSNIPRNRVLQLAIKLVKGNFCVVDQQLVTPEIKLTINKTI